MSRTQRSQHSESRSGVVLVVIVVVMVMMSLVIAGTIRPVRDEADLATLRVETTRALYAAESGVIVAMNAAVGRIEMPAQGSAWEFQGQRVEYLELPEDGPTVVIQGVSGNAVRRLELTID